MSGRVAALRRAALQALRASTPRGEASGLPPAALPTAACALHRGFATRGEAAEEAPPKAARTAQRPGRPDAAAAPPPAPRAPKAAGPKPSRPPLLDDAPEAASTDDLAKVGRGEDDEYAFVDFSEEAESRLLPEGCPALKAEFEHSRSRRLMVRPAFLRLRERVLGADPASCAGTRPPLVLEGPSGAGKSVMLAMLVAAARSAGWLALYVPRGRSMCEGSSFARHGESDEWNTPDHARELLTNLNAAHGALLAKLPRRVKGAPAGTLKDLLRVLGEQNPSAADVTDAGLAMLAELQLIKEMPVLVAIDELNALSGWSEYHAVTGPRSRLKLEAGALRITAALRRLDAPLARGVRVGATSASAGISPRVHLAGLPADPRGSLRRQAPRYNETETYMMLQHYKSYGMVPGLLNLDEEQVADVSFSMHALCVGSGTILRKNAVMAMLDRAV